jgi:hypothetical protein
MNLGKLLEETYSALGFIRLRSLATGGSATTIIDTALAIQYPTNGFKKHIFFISQTTDGLSPQSKFGVLPAAHYVAATQTFTIPTVTDSVGAGDIYAIAKPTVDLYEMLGQINLAMAKLPAVRLSDVSLTAAKDTLEYTLPLAVKGYEIQEVWIGNATDGYQKDNNYRVRPAVGGSTEKLVLGTQPDYDPDTAADHTIDIIYLGRQTTLSVYSNTISEKYPDELVYSCCFMTALEYYMKKKGLMINRRWTPILEGAKERFNRAMAENLPRAKPASLQRTVELGRM